ncbi:MAG: hypothetical protein JXR76_20120 [Deltaproteobacteria bacterium]|nr:hypothetical protein [Deltaproteobacteria bacterium]
MIHTAQLQRLDRRSVEAKATIFAGALCLFLWFLFGVSIWIFFGDWYGFGVGFIVSALISALFTWTLYIRPTARERKVVRASWRGKSFRIYDPIEDRQENIDFAMPHKAVLILSKVERQFLLRLEQCINNTEVRIDIIGQSPIALPMRAMGEATSLFGFFGKAHTDSARSKPYRLKEVADRESLSHALLAFVEEHRATRDSEIRVNKNGDIIRWNDGCFSLHADSHETSFGNLSALDLEFMVQPTKTIESPGDDKGMESAEILIALVPDGDKTRALVFSIIAPGTMVTELPGGWDIPQRAMKRKFTLYDDSVLSHVFARTLKNIIKQRVPNSPVLDVLRH